MKFVDLFSGLGGFSLGLERAGMTCVGHVEQDKFCQRILKKHWPHVPLISDVREVRGDEFGTVDLLCGGPPCQPVSLAGKRRGEEDDRWLWGEALRLTAEIRPAWCLFENPVGIVTMGLDRILAEMESLGYSAWTVEIPACAVDAPQIRMRVWILGYADGTTGELHTGKLSQTQKRISGARLEDGDFANGFADTGEGDVGGTQAQRFHGSGRTRTRRVGSEDAACMERAASGGLKIDAQSNGEPEDNAADGDSSRADIDGPSVWAGAEWIECWDGKRRRVKPGLQLVAPRLPGDVARLRAIGNAVSPELVERIGRAILKSHRRTP